MSDKSQLKEKYKEKSPALYALGDIPKIGSFGGVDFSLGWAHEYAMRLAADTLSTLTGKGRELFSQSLLQVFWQWQDEHGVYPPSGLGLLFMGKNEKPEAAKDYINRICLAAALDDTEPKIPLPWECCNEAKTPLGLFEVLFVDGYPPLTKLLDKNWESYNHIIAILILMSDKPNTDQSGDCIKWGIKLAQMRMRLLQSELKKYQPLSEKEAHRKQMQKSKAELRREEKLNRILTLREKLKNEGKPHSNKALAITLNMKEPTLSRILTDAGHRKYQKRIEPLNSGILAFKNAILSNINPK